MFDRDFYKILKNKMIEMGYNHEGNSDELWNEFIVNALEEMYDFEIDLMEEFQRKDSSIT